MMHLSAAASAMQATFTGVDTAFSSVGTDSRAVSAGQLFFALKGDRFDGHDYAQSVLDQGAAAVVMNQDSPQAENISQAILVDDTYRALGDLAAAWRNRFTGPVVGVTGSNGKTTVKEMLASILKAHVADVAVLATKGNLNNHIGVPLTLLSIQAQHAYAVVEMGMNHSGEIRYLSKMASPDVVLINNAGDAHLGELGSLKAIAEAKGEIIEGVRDGGTVVLKGDDTFYPLWLALADGKKRVTFGRTEQHDVYAETVGNALAMNTPQGQIMVTLNSLGEHNVNNALSATAAAMAMNIPLQAVKTGLAQFEGVPGRLQRVQGLAGAIVIDDTYNANPMSMRAAIDVLKQFAGTKVLVVGDMGELGDAAAAKHIEIGEYAKAAGIDAVYSLGELSKQLSQAFGQPEGHFETVEALIETIKPRLETIDTVLVKGSRSMKMERVVNAVKQNTEKY